MERILVTGSTGFIGYEVSRILASQGWKPRLMVRRPLRGPLVSSLDAEIIQANLESPESLERAVEGMDTIIHLAARATTEEYALLRPTILGGSVALMKAAQKAGVKNFVFSSSLLVYSNQTQPIGKETPVGTKIGYGRAKLEAERALSDMAQETGINRSTLSDLEKGKNCSVITLIQLLRSLNLLKVLEQFQVKQQLSPLQLAKLEQAKRKRASRAGNTGKKPGPDW